MSARGNDTLKRVRRLLDDHGVGDPVIQLSKGHIKVKWRYKDKPLMYVLGTSPSDVRARENALHDIRRMMRAA